MSVFVDAAEVESCIGKMFVRMVDDPEIVKNTANSGLVIRLNYSDPDCTFLIDFPERSALFGDEAVQATNASVDLYMKCDDAHRFWLGKLNFPVAMAQRKVRMEGSTAKALKLLPLTKTLFAAYHDHLRGIGRDDLIEKA